MYGGERVSDKVRALIHSPISISDYRTEQKKIGQRLDSIDCILKDIHENSKIKSGQDTDRAG